MQKQQFLNNNSLLFTINIFSVVSLYNKTTCLIKFNRNVHTYIFKRIQNLHGNNNSIKNTGSLPLNMALSRSFNKVTSTYHDLIGCEIKIHNGFSRTIIYGNLTHFNNKSIVRCWSNGYGGVSCSTLELTIYFEKFLYSNKYFDYICYSSQLYYKQQILDEYNSIISLYQSQTLKITLKKKLKENKLKTENNNQIYIKKKISLIINPITTKIKIIKISDINQNIAENIKKEKIQEQFNRFNKVFPSTSLEQKIKKQSIEKSNSEKNNVIDKINNE